MADDKVWVPTEYFAVSHTQPVRILTGELGYPTAHWARGFVSDILKKLAMENTITDDADACNCVLALLPNGLKAVMVVRNILPNEQLQLHGCPRCNKEFMYEGPSPPDCTSIFHAKGHTVVCPKCG